jgi:hypothetical protein
MISRSKDLDTQDSSQVFKKNWEKITSTWAL